MSKENVIKNVIKKINPPIKCIGIKDGKFYALIEEGCNIHTKSNYYYLIPWENRLDWKRKNIEPEEILVTKFDKKYRFAE